MRHGSCPNEALGGRDRCESAALPTVRLSRHCLRQSDFASILAAGESPAVGLHLQSDLAARLSASRRLGDLGSLIVSGRLPGPGCPSHCNLASPAELSGPIVAVVSPRPGSCAVGPIHGPASHSL